MPTAARCWRDRRRSVDELFRDVPESARLGGPVAGLPIMPASSRSSAPSGLCAQEHVAGDAPFFLGAGAYRHHVPATVDYMIQRGEFLTSYTPYQPEITQGTLQILFEFQTQVALLRLEVANASMYDGSTAPLEAVLMANRDHAPRQGADLGGLHPQYRSIIETMAQVHRRRARDVAAELAAETDAEELIARDRQGDLLRRRAEPDFFGRIARLRRRSPRPAMPRARC